MLRNESGRVLRAVEAGETFVVTNAGVPVGRLVPLDHDPPGLRIVRPARYLNIKDFISVLRIIDKIHKIGTIGVEEELCSIKIEGK